MSILRVGIIGLGRMGVTHYSILNANPSVKIIAVCDASSLINIFFKKYFPKVKFYKDYRLLLENEPLDALIVSTPPNYHYEIVKIAIENNIHVFCEKPFTTSPEKSEELACLAEKDGVVNQVGYVNRFNTLFLKAKELVEQNIIGNIVNFKSEMYSNTISKKAKHNNWRASRISGGGCLNEMGSHAIDLVNYIIGVPDKVSGSCLKSIYSERVEDYVASTFIYISGIVGKLEVNWCEPHFRKPVNRMEILGEKGCIEVDQQELIIDLKENDPTMHLNSGINKIYITDIFQPVPFYLRGYEFSSQLYNFVDTCMSGNGQTLCSFREASKTNKIISMIRDNFIIGGDIENN